MRGGAFTPARWDFALGAGGSIALHLVAVLCLTGVWQADTIPPELAQPATTRLTVQMPPPRPVEPAVQTPQRQLSELPLPAAMPPPIARQPPPPAPMPEAKYEITERIHPPAPTLAPPPAVMPVAATLAQLDLDGDFDRAPEPKQAIKPVYPEAARQRGESGSVDALVRISADGKVESVELTSGSGSDDLDAAAIRALRKARFRPAHRGSSAVSSRVRITIDFRLRN